jgi:hypothetical protein
MFDQVPEVSVETGSETVRTGASIGVHLEEGILNLLRGEGIIDGSELSDVVRVERIEIKTPNSGFGDPEKILEKGMEEGGLMIMGIEFNPIVFEDGNFVFPKALRGRHVEEFGVFTLLDDRFDFTSLFPKQHFCLIALWRELMTTRRRDFSGHDRRRFSSRWSSLLITNLQSVSLCRTGLRVLAQDFIRKRVFLIATARV